MGSVEWLLHIMLCCEYRWWQTIIWALGYICNDQIKRKYKELVFKLHFPWLVQTKFQIKLSTDWPFPTTWDLVLAIMSWKSTHTSQIIYILYASFPHLFQILKLEQNVSKCGFKSCYNLVYRKIGDTCVIIFRQKECIFVKKLSGMNCTLQIKWIQIAV